MSGWRPSRSGVRVGAFLIVAALLLLASGPIRDDLRDFLATHRATIQTWSDHHPGLAAAAMFALYTSTTAAMLPVALPLSLLCGVLFGSIGGTVVAAGSATSGSTLAMILSRTFFRGWISTLR